MTDREIIGRMVETIVKQFLPDKVILFGSYANGTPGPNSDVDLLVIMPVEKGTKRKKAAEIDGALSDRKIPLDVIVARPEEIEPRRINQNAVISFAIRNGITLYDRAA